MPPKKDPFANGFQYTKTSGLKYKFGAHVTASGGVSNSVLNARNIGANSFALFLKSPRKWDSPPITDKESSEFKRLCELHGYDPKTDVLPHGSYFINLANPDKEKETKAYDGFLDDLKRCEQLGIGLFNFHPGSSLGSDHDEAIARLAENINSAINETSTVKIVIENMAGHGHLLGSKLEDLRDVIALIDNKDRVGVCLDTCHTFAAGYDIRTEEGFDRFINQFDEIVGAQYLSAIHLNDSKVDLGANRDLHQRLGWGYLGLEVFRVIANHPRMQNIPIILETPSGEDPKIWGDEIKLLESMLGKEKGDAELLAKAEEECKRGMKERVAAKKVATPKKRSAASSGEKPKKVQKRISDSAKKDT